MTKETAIQITARLSDAQEHITRGNKEEARELINEAKTTLFAAVQENAGAATRSLAEFPPLTFSMFI